jgi:hypothetical protein
MSDIKIQPSATGSGTVTITAPTTNTARVITLPDGTGTLAFTTGDDDKLPLSGGAMTGTITGFTSTGIDDNADATSITIDSSEGVGIKNTVSNSMYYKGLAVGNGSSGDQGITIYNTTWGALAFADSTSGDGRYEGSISYNHSTNSMYLATNHATALQITSDGRGLSQFTAKAWCKWAAQGTSSNLTYGHNVSSVSYVATGHWRINYTNSLTYNYSATMMVSDNGGRNTTFKVGEFEQAYCGVFVTNMNQSGTTSAIACFTAFGE